MHRLLFPPPLPPLRLSLPPPLLLPLLLAACFTAPERRYSDSPVVPPDSWSAAHTSPGDPPARWWDGFEDPGLSAAIDEALLANRDLRAAAARVEAAAASARAAGAARLPTLGLNADGSRRRQNFVGFPVPGGGSVLSTTSTSYGVSLDLEWELDLWGRLSAATEAARADLLARAEDLRGARLSLEGQVAKTWFALVEARNQRDLAQATADSYDHHLELVGARYRLGTADALDLSLLQNQAASARAQLAARREALEALSLQLQVLRGLRPDGSGVPAGDLPALPPLPATGLPAALAARRPDLAAAWERVAASDLRLSQARGALLPSLRLGASVGRVSNQLSDLSDPDLSTWSLMGSLFQPLFEGGRLRAAVDAADATTRAALEAYAQAWLAALGEVETALAGEQWLAAQEAEQSRAAESARAARRLAEQRYDAGLVDVLFLLDARRREWQAESARLAARAALLENRIDLHLALGGGLQADDAANDAAADAANDAAADAANDAAADAANDAANDVAAEAAADAAADASEEPPA